MDEVALDLAATARHTYSAEWTAERIGFSSTTSRSAPCTSASTTRLQLMVNLFEFPTATARDPAAYPKTGEVRAVSRRPEPSGFDQASRPVGGRPGTAE